MALANNNETSVTVFAPLTTELATLPTALPTILSHLHHLLDIRQSQNLSLPYLHPYAPLTPQLSARRFKSEKGKEKEDYIPEVEVIKELREAVRVWKRVVSGSESGRLSQPLKEIITHQSTLLPTASILHSLSLPLNNPNPPFPSARLSIPPHTLLQHLSVASGLQTFVEDSQFGLQQSSLAIAGERCVVDVDLGVDLGGEEDESRMGTPMVGMTPTETPFMIATPLISAVPPTAGTIHSDERAKVKLLKLVASHVTPSGGTGQSSYICAVLSDRINSYLALYNSPPSPQSLEAKRGDDLWEKEQEVRKLEAELRDLKELDDVAKGCEGVDWFEELEKLVDTLEELRKGSSQQRIYLADDKTVYPTFKLLPPSTASITPTFNPIWRIRPARKPVETVPCVDSSFDKSKDEDINMEEKWLSTEWVIECKDDSGIGGIVASRDWLNNVERDELNGIRVESLLYRQYPQPAFLPLQQQAFPYTAPFVHPSRQGSLEQHWSMALPGPLGFVIGRALRRQVVLNQMFASVFKPQVIQPYNASEEDANTDLEDILGKLILNAAFAKTSQARRRRFQSGNEGPEYVKVEGVENIRGKMDLVELVDNILQEKINDPSSR
ncbi:uncharacterized protein L203_101411 [Cryptococcus depauperatus CBS 7841]|uniref:Uncharacterized protein n=1 Tax=Cryptococcus depauperatus CBS 7841 TaxID=1295531 RepID=A0AAJ8LZ53_9TREE